MAKKITTRTDIPMQGYSTNEAPYLGVLGWLLENKTGLEAEKEKQAFEESFTYLLICEEGRFSLPVSALLDLYQAEKEEGYRGFFKKLLYYNPRLLD